jgi:hypothetical protein
VVTECFQEGRLRFGGRPVDFIGEQELRENRPLAKLKAILARVIAGHDAGADDVGGHQIGRELDAAELEIEHPRQGLDELRLAEAGHAFQQHVPAGEDRDECGLDGPLLTDDYLPDGGAGLMEVVLEALGFVLQGGGVGHGRLLKGKRADRSSWYEQKKEHSASQNRFTPHRPPGGDGGADRVLHITRNVAHRGGSVMTGVPRQGAPRAASSAAAGVRWWTSVGHRRLSVAAAVWEHWRLW